MVFPVSLAIFLIIVSLFVTFCVTYNDSPSMPVGFYIRLPAWSVEVGDLVEVENPMGAGYLGVRALRLLKRVVSIDDGYYTVRGEDPRSYDSRYFGAVGRSAIKARIFPLLTYGFENPRWLVELAEKNKQKGDIE
jgi:type IV secretory pathway protease TraF